MKTAFAKSIFCAWNLKLVWCKNWWSALLGIWEIWLCRNQQQNCHWFWESWILSVVLSALLFIFFLPFFLLLSLYKHGGLVKNIDMFMTPLLLWREVSRCHYQKTCLKFCLAFLFFILPTYPASRLNSCMKDILLFWVLCVLHCFLDT